MHMDLGGKGGSVLNEEGLWPVSDASLIWQLINMSQTLPSARGDNIYSMCTNKDVTAENT